MSPKPSSEVMSADAIIINNFATNPKRRDILLKMS
jgi:hypothetical protein